MPTRRARTGTTILTIVGLGVLGLTGCGSSGAADPISTTPAPVTPTSAPTPAPSTSATPVIGVPTPSATATQPPKQYPVPKGARPVAHKYCSDVGVSMGNLQIAMDGMLEDYATARSVVLYNLKHDYQTYRADRAQIVAARAAWIRAGYKATFPSVRDMDQMIAAAADLLTASKQVDITAIPAIYPRYNTAYIQYANDTSNAICPGPAPAG